MTSFFRYIVLSLLICCVALSFKQASSVKVAVLKYSGGGDWYANPTSLPNLVEYCNDKLGTNIDTEIGTAEVGSPELFNYALVHMTGHGNVVFNENDVRNLRLYLESGGFMHIDDNYGLDKYVRREMKKVFPESEFVELPFEHAIYHQQYDFPQGLPKVHEHDGKAPQGFGLFHNDRLVCFYTYECDLGDGWEDEDVHNDSQAIHEKSLKMGANIISYAFGY